MSRTLLVFGDKTFKITVPDDAKITFGPWSPPNAKADCWSDGEKRGTLRVYQGGKENILAVFAGVTGFRDMSAISYAEEVVREEGATIWRDDEHGYMRSSSRQATKAWVEGDPAGLIEAPKPRVRRARKA